MGTETRTKQIGAFSYKLETFGAKKGMSTLLILVRFLGPSLSTVAAALQGKPGGGWDMSTEGLTRSLESFSTTAKPEDFATIVEAFASSTTVLYPTQTKAGPGEAMVSLSKVYDAHFAGKYRDLILWLVWAIQENYESFFSGTPLGQGEQPSQGPTPSQ